MLPTIAVFSPTRYPRRQPTTNLCITESCLPAYQKARTPCPAQLLEVDLEVSKFVCDMQALNRRSSGLLHTGEAEPTSTDISSPTSPAEPRRTYSVRWPRPSVMPPPNGSRLDENTPLLEGSSQSRSYRDEGTATPKPRLSRHHSATGTP